MGALEAPCHGQRHQWSQPWRQEWGDLWPQVLKTGYSLAEDGGQFSDDLPRRRGNKTGVDPGPARKGEAQPTGMATSDRRLVTVTI